MANTSPARYSWRTREFASSSRYSSNVMGGCGSALYGAAGSKTPSRFRRSISTHSTSLSHSTRDNVRIAFSTSESVVIRRLLAGPPRGKPIVWTDRVETSSHAHFCRNTEKLNDVVPHVQ